MAEQAIKRETSVSQLRCIGCGSTALPDRFRCEHCRDLLEIIFPGWEQAGPVGLTAQSLKNLWSDRRPSLEPADQSGVWRFREILPALVVFRKPSRSSDCEDRVSSELGIVSILTQVSSRKIVDVNYIVKHEDVHRQHFGFHGGVCRPRRFAQPCAHT